mgnify:CR=1 FL=1
MLKCYLLSCILVFTCKGKVVFEEIPVPGIGQENKVIQEKRGSYLPMKALQVGAIVALLRYSVGKIGTIRGVADKFKVGVRKRKVNGGMREKEVTKDRVMMASGLRSENPVAAVWI